VLFVLVLLIYVRTDSFQDMVHRRLVSALEQITGGRVELGKFTVVPFRFRVEVYDLTIHGKEAPDVVPYAHAGHLIAEISIISIFEKEFGFHSIALDHPVIHIITYPDGTTNQPTPKIQQTSGSSPVQQLFSLSINRLQVMNGELLWNDRRIPLDLSASDLSSEMNYSILRRRYDGYLHIAKLDSVYPGYRPFSSAVRAQFSLGEAYIELQALEVKSGRSHIEASGRIDDFLNPHFSGTYNARLDLPQMGSILRIPELRSGSLQFDGKANISAQNFISTGKLLVKDFELQEPLFRLQKANLSTAYEASRARLKLSQAQLMLLGGAATGDAEIVNWLSSAEPNRKKKRFSAEEQRGTIALKFREISVGEVASAMTTRKLPLNRLRFAGAAAGQVNAKWKGSYRNLEAGFVLAVAPPAAPSRGQIPLTSTATGAYRAAGDELELSNLDVSTRATQIHAAGRLSSVSSLRFTAATTNLDEWQPLLSSLRGPQIPVVLRGRAIFNGTASGRLSNFAINSHMRVTDFDSVIPATATSSSRAVHWDSLVAELQASPRAISAGNGLLERAKTTVAFDLSALLQKSQLTETSPFTARIHVKNASVAELQSLLGADYPVAGQIDLLLTASGTRLDPHAEGQFELRNGSVHGQPLSRLNSNLRYNAGELQFNNALLVYKEAQITGNAAYKPTAREFRFNLNGIGFQLSQIPQLQKARMSVEGAMDFTAQGSGNLDAPVINASVHLRDLTLDQERAGDFDIEAVTHGADLQLTGRSKFEKAELSIDGNVRLRERWPADLRLKFDRLDVDSLLRAHLGDKVTGHSAVAGSLHLVGPVRQARELSATADLTQLFLNIEKIAVQNEGPVRFVVKDQVLSLEQLRLLGEGTDITAHGTAQLNGNQELSLRADGRLNFKLVENFSPDLTASGIMNVGVNVSGTYNRPSLLGQIQVHDASISSIDLPNGFSNMNGILAFNQDRLDIQSVTAQVGGGNVNLSGYVTYTPALSFNITAEGRDVRLRPAGISATSNAQLRLAGTSSDALLSGDVTIVKLNVAPGFDFARYLESTKQAATLPQSNTLLNKVRLDIHVVTTPELQMQSSMAKLSGEADLHMRGTLVRPVVLGRVDIMEGEVSFSGTKYRLERGEITFAGPTGIKPTLDLQAATHVRDYDITLGVNGTPEKLNFTYRSEPPLPSADIVALLALGRTQSGESAALSGSSQTAFSQQASNVILNQALNATLNNRTQRLFGISNIKVDPQGLNTETTPTRSAPAVTIEQQISNDFTLTYSTEVSQASQQVIQAEYNVTRNISILGVRDQNGVVSFDIRLRQRRK
jgi:translocation and assembly module TamB